MITLDCPLGESCPLEALDCFEFDAASDSDDYRTWHYGEFTQQYCPCDLTEQEWAVLQEAADRRAVDAYYNWEPPGLR